MKEKDDDDDEILQIKMILLGNTAVGKTSIINRYVEDNFSSNLMSSVNMTFIQKTLKIDKQKVQLNIWDTVGQEKFRSLSKLFFNLSKVSSSDSSKQPKNLLIIGYLMDTTSNVVFIIRFLYFTNLFLIFFDEFKFEINASKNSEYNKFWEV